MAVPAPTTPSQRKRRVLLLTKSSGFQHDVIAREGDRLAYAERTVTCLGATHGFEVTCTKDASLITPQNLKNYDTVMFFTTGELNEAGEDGHPPMSDRNRRDLLNWVKNGGGFYGAHTATDTFHTYKPYIKLVGGEFKTHGAQQFGTVKVVDPKFPAVAGLPVEFRIWEEWYFNANVNLNKDMHVLAVLETEGMEGECYECPPYPILWASQYGRGRVFMNPLGHGENVWDMPMFQGLVAAGLEWTFGDLPGNAKPNYDRIIGKAKRGRR